MLAKRTIGALSQETGVKVTTIRYYESIGFMSEPDRTESGQRIYSAEDVQRLNFIRHARELGLPMKAIRELLALQDEPNQGCDSIDAIARRHLDDIRNRIDQLTALEKELGRIVRSCEGGQVQDCKVIESLNDHESCYSDHPKRLFDRLQDG